MNVAVIGASSSIGAALASAFAPANHLRLLGRDPLRLHASAQRCRDSGAASVDPCTCDLSLGPGGSLAALAGWPVDLLIHAASATSRLRDHAIPIERMREAVEVDVLAPLEMIAALCAAQPDRPPRVIFVSTILTVVRSPDRAIYPMLKSLHELGLMRLQAACPELEVLVVRVGKVLPVDAVTADARRLAGAVLRAFRRRRQIVYFGAEGRALVGLFRVHPALFELVIRARRMVQQ